MADLGNLGRGYLIALWLGMTGLLVWLLLGGFPWGTERFEFEAIRYAAFITSAALAYGIAAWGLLRRRKWAYYLSWILCAYVLAMTGPKLLTEGTNNRWAYSLFFVPGVIALIWLITPSGRAQLRPVQDVSERAAAERGS